MKHIIVVLTAWLLAAPAALHAQSSPPARPVKKLIEYGWDVPYPDQVRKDIRNMEKKPFDGVIFRLREWNHAFDPRPWDEAKLKPQLDDLAAIEWRTFTDNFLCLYAANNWKMALYMDQVLDLRQPPEQYLAHYLTPAERLRFFEHHAYHALTTSDEYVWCYSERMHWWQDKVPDGAEAAIRAARALIAQGRNDQGERLRAEVAEFVAAGQKKLAERPKGK
jgi:hypothetical protein